MKLHSQTLTTGLSIVSLLTSAVTAIGINCQSQGPADCGSNKAGLYSSLSSLVADTTLLDSSNVYAPYQWIACSGNSCIRTINTKDYHITGDHVRDLLIALTRNGCGTCGTSPFDPMHNNDVSGGALQVSAEKSPLPCSGLCVDANGNTPSLNLQADFHGISLTNPCPAFGSPEWSARNKADCDFPGISDQQIIDSANN